MLTAKLHLLCTMERILKLYVISLEEGQTNTFLKNEDGKIIANAESKILENISSKPKYRGDPLIQEDFKAPVASFAEWKKLKKRGV